MASEIEEIVEADPQPRCDHNPHNDDTKRSDNDRNSDTDSNGDINGNSVGEINGNSYGGRVEEKKKYGNKGSLTRVLCYLLLRARSRVTGRIEKSSSSSKKDKQVDIRSEYKGNNSPNPSEPELDAHLPNLLSEHQFKQSSFFKEFCKSFEALEPQERNCLSSFILFPANTVVKKRLLVYWWIGEGYLDDSKTFEDSATSILNKFLEKSFILPVKKNCQKVGSSFKMHPHVRSAMIVLTLEAKSLDSRSDESMFSWYDDRVFLLNTETLEELENEEKVKTLFNVNKESIVFKLESFLKMKDVKVIYLGRWQSSAEHHHIEVADSEFLKGLKNMENLRFFGLQGISGIQELPSSISNLRNLKILDLRACYNLEKLPKEIASLKKLTHLDISECYLLDCMPREILSLSELQVLKGFVITDTKNRIFCTLGELSGLKKLRKLSVNLNSVTFSTDDFSAVFRIKQLVKLKITWGGKFSKVQNKKSKQENRETKSKATSFRNMKSFKRQESAVREVLLEKLELQCLPHDTLPIWVSPDKLTKLKKLYIRGGGLKSLGRNQRWKVEVLRLRYLNELNMNWGELRTLFPDLQYLEKFKCPKLTLCPCDCTGVWDNSSTKERATLPQTTS